MIYPLDIVSDIMKYPALSMRFNDYIFFEHDNIFQASSNIYKNDIKFEKWLVFEGVNCIKSVKRYLHFLSMMWANIDALVKSLQEITI